jgi:hypothetical protein
MSLNQNRGTTEPSLKDLLDLHRKTTLLEFNAHHVGIIRSFDAESQTVQATIAYKKTYRVQNNSTGVYENILEDYPILVDCPAVIVSGGLARLETPIQAGDTCLILFNDRDIDNWFKGGQVNELATQRLHSFSDGIALVGIRSLANSFEDYDPTRMALRWKQGSHDVRVGVGPQKVLLENEIHTLKELLQDLIDNVKDLVSATAAITVSGVTPGGGSSGLPVNAATITAVNTALTTTSTRIGELLE